MKIDTSEFPVRAVVTATDTTAYFYRNQGISKLLKLGCGHQIGLKKGYDVPKEAGCMMCAKANGLVFKK
mgnify:CR=1 FL=1